MSDEQDLFVRHSSFIVHRSSFHSRSAFTLLELMLVLGLLAVISAMTWPLLERPFALQRLRHAADQVRVQWSRARNAAITSGQVQAFYYEPGGVQCYFEPYALLEDSVESSALSFSSSPSVATIELVTLPERIMFGVGQTADDARSLAMSATSAPMASMSGAWTSPILFYPDGTAATAYLSVASDDGREIPIALRGITGASAVGEVQASQGAVQ